MQLGSAGGAVDTCCDKGPAGDERGRVISRRGRWTAQRREGFPALQRGGWPDGAAAGGAPTRVGSGLLGGLCVALRLCVREPARPPRWNRFATQLLSLAVASRLSLVRSRHRDARPRGTTSATMTKTQLVPCQLDPDCQATRRMWSSARYCVVSPRWRISIPEPIMPANSPAGTAASPSVQRMPLSGSNA